MSTPVSPQPPQPQFHWDRRAVTTLLKRPDRLFRDASAQAWIQQHGGLAAVRVFLQAAPLTDPQLQLLSVLLQLPHATAFRHAEELNIDRATYFRWLRALTTLLADALNSWGQEILAAPPAPQTSVAGSRHQLRAPILDFVGRAAEVQRLRDALQAAAQAEAGIAICGVQGMGGIGKTELAYQVAHLLRDTFPDAQIVLDLQGSRARPLTPAQALQMVIRTFTPDAQLPDDVDQLQLHYRMVLHDQRALIVADDAHDVT